MREKKEEILSDYEYCLSDSEKSRSNKLFLEVLVDLRDTLNEINHTANNILQAINRMNLK